MGQACIHPRNAGFKQLTPRLHSSSQKHPRSNSKFHTYFQFSADGIQQHPPAGFAPERLQACKNRIDQPGETHPIFGMDSHLFRPDMESRGRGKDFTDPIRRD